MTAQTQTKQKTQEPAKGQSRKRGARWFLKKLLQSPSGTIGVVITLAIVVVAIFAPYFAPFDPLESDYAAILQAPLEGGHILGTDQLGRDILSRLIYGARISLIIGFSTVVLAGAIGTMLGMIAGYYGGWLDTIIMRAVDIQLSFPFILLALTINAIMGLGLRNIIISLIIAGWVVYARVARGEVIQVRESEYVEAAKALGANSFKILFKHVLPNILTPLIIISTLQVAQFIIAEAAISFLGFGIQPPDPAWGNMLSEGRDMLFVTPWLVTWPGVALALTALGINLAGDWLRDTFDPKLQA